MERGYLTIQKWWKWYSLMSDEAPFILLKWGTLKSWQLSDEKSLALVNEYGRLGVEMSAMRQHDTSEQKRILCDLIESHDGLILNDWSGESYTKQQAKDYVMNYGKPVDIDSPMMR